MKSEWAAAEKSIANDYLNFCKKASEDVSLFTNFRSHNDYGVILEGGEKRIGLGALKYLKRLGGYDWFKNNFSEIIKNDLYGNPILHSFNKSINCSSSTLQYSHDLYNCILLLNKNTNLPLTIVEVGGGFGGFARLVLSLLNVEKYYLIDQKEPLALAKKYLDNFPRISKKVIYIEANEIFKIYSTINDIDLFVASASIAELDFNTQKFYFENFIQKSLFSYLIYNTVHLEGFKDFLNSCLTKLNKKNFDIKIHNPWFRILYIYISHKKINAKIFGKENQKFWNYFKGIKCFLLRGLRSVRYKIFGIY